MNNLKGMWESKYLNSYIDLMIIDDKIMIIKLGMFLLKINV